MSREEIEKLLGGYATDTLTEAERRALFEAAVDDQDLFNSLAGEQALLETLRDPAARQELITALAPVREPLGVRLARAWRRPAVLAAAAGVAALVVIGGLVFRQGAAPRREVLVADAVASRPAPRPTIAAPNKQFRLPQPAPARQKAILPEPPALRDAQEMRAPANLPAAAPAPPPPQASVEVSAAAPLVAYETGDAAGKNAKMKKSAALSARLEVAKTVAAAHAQMSYTLLLRQADKSYQPVPSGTAFHAGDFVRVQAEAADPGTLYLLRKGDTGERVLVARVAAEPGHLYALPPDGALQSPVPGRMELLLVFERASENAPKTVGGAPELLSKPAGQAVFNLVLEFR